MIDACRDLEKHLAREPQHLGAGAEAHLATCLACRQLVAAHQRMLAALQVEPDPVDDVTRARWLARMSPELDAIAAARGGGRRNHRRAWLAAAGAVAVAAALAFAVFGRGAATPPAKLATVERAADPVIERALDREVLRPYVFAGAATDERTATTFLAGRFATLEVGRGQLVRASFDHDRDQRIAVVGPTTVAGAAATTAAVALDLDGVLLVDMRSSTRIDVRARGLAIRAQHATFAVQTAVDAVVVYVDRGELAIGTTVLHAGDWYAPAAERAPSLVALLREHANALAPPKGSSGILAVAGETPVVTRQGGVLGTAPLWARVEPGALELAVAHSAEPRETVVVTGAAITRVAAAPAVTPPAPRRDPRPAEIVATSPVVEAPARARAPRETAAQRYARAEAALRAGDRPGAEAILIELVDRDPRSSQAASALYDLATLNRTRDRRAAHGYLARLLAGAPPAALREPARYLQCRLRVEAGELDAAATCLAAFRSAFPGSSHDAEVLGWLAGRAEETGGCASAHALSIEYLDTYPHGPFAARAAACKAAAP